METRETRFKEKQDTIEKKEKQEKRKKIALRIFKVFFCLFLFFVFSISYITQIGTSSFIVKEEKIVDNKLPSAFHGLKVIVFGDIHYKSTFLKKDLEKLKNDINIRKPDLIFFVGDLFQGEEKVKKKEVQEIEDFLMNLEAKLGKYAVLGETDKEDAITALETGKFQILNDQSELIYQNESDPILLIGIDSRQKVPNFDQAFSYFKEESANQSIFTITLFHHPDTLTSVLNTKEVNLAFAGHSHNGQVRLPYLPPFLIKEGAENYYDPFYQVGNTKLYITSGLGTSDYHYRIFARPTLSFFRLSTS